MKLKTDPVEGLGHRKMPPSPSLRRSPGRELRMESTHKRGRSYESGLPLKAKDDDLVLFNEIQNRERDNFLLHTSDDVDDSISKLRYFTDFKRGTNIPARGESSDLLNADGEKNDYDWLLTPPDTPLFRSLDDDEPLPVNLFRGRTRTQPISISRSSKGEKTLSASRSSASPHRLSPSPCSGFTAVQSRNRPSSAPCSSPPAVLRPATPSRRPSTPPAKTSTPAPRSLTPTLRRMSTGSSGPAVSSGRIGTSPVKSSRGNSASPKFRGWQLDLPGFSADAPPNLRTSLPERSASRSRGLSPASSSGRNSSSKFGRQSISPSASRSASSPHSHERDQCIFYSRASMASSGDDDADSILSVTVRLSDNSAVRKYGAFANSRPLAFSKKPSRSPSASSALKRSFDSALRQMDRKTPHNMFRPLLSSVPTTTFYTGKATSVHRPMFSRNSSLTTSSNASSEQGASVVPDMEDSDHDQSELAGEWKKIKDPEIQEEIFSFDKSDELTEDNHDDTHGEKLSSCNENYDENIATKVKSKEPQQTFAGDDIDAVNTTSFPQSLDSAELSVVDCNETMGTCSKCGREFLILGVYSEHDICQECAAVDGLLASGEIESSVVLVKDADTLCNKVLLRMKLPKLPEKESSGAKCDRDETNTGQDTDCRLEICPNQLVVDSGDQKLPELEVDNMDKVSALESGGQSPSEPTAYPGLKVDNPRGTGISVLLMKRSSSSKWPVVQGRAFSATNILCSEPSYARDNMNAMKHSLGRESSSASSVDLGSSRQTDGHVLCQLSSRKGEMDNVRNSCNVYAQNYSETSMHATEPLVHPKSELEKDFCSTLGTMENDVMQGTLMKTEKQDKSYQNTNLNALESSSSEQAGIGEDLSVCSGTSIAPQLCYTSAADILDDKNCAACENAGAACENAGEAFFQHVESCVPDTKPVATPDSSFVEDSYMINDANCRDNVSDAVINSSSVLVLEQQIDQDCRQDSLNECTSSQIPRYVEDFQEVRISTASDKDFMVTASANTNELPACEEPRATVEAPRKHMQRSFTLEEATDTVLFCSSIVHDMAYKAVTIGMEKEMALQDAPRPIVTVLGKSVSNQNDSRSIPTRRVLSTQKVKRKRLETDSKVSTTELENAVKDQEYANSIANANVSNTVDSMKPPKLESKCNCTVM